MTSKRPQATALALLFLVLLLAGLGLRIWAAHRIIGQSGPTHIATLGEQVMLFAGGRLFHLSAGGELLSATPLERTGLHDDPVELRFLPDGSLLVAGQRPATIRKCDPATWVCRPVAAAAARLIERQLKALPDTAPEVWLLTDARGDALWRLAPEATPEALLPAGTLAGPNDLAYAGDGAVWVADTDHRRIVELVPGRTGGYSLGREHSAANEYLTGPAWYPMMLARGADGFWWVTQAAEFSESLAELLVYDPETGPVARVALPAGAYPTDIAASGEAMLVTDMDRFAVYRVTVDSRTVEPFGDDSFRARLAEIRQQRAGFESVSRWALIAVVACGVLMVLAAVLASPADRRWSNTPALFDWESAPREVPRTSGIHWLERDPATERSLKWAERLVYVLLPLPVVGAIAVYLAIYAQTGPEAGAEIEARLNEIGVALLLASLTLALMVPVVRSSMQTMRTRLGTDGRRLYLRGHDGREIAVDPPRLAWTDRMILYREYTLPLTGGPRRPLYRPGEVETWLGPLLRQARRVSAVEALKHQWRHATRARLWWLAAAAGLGAALVGVLIAL